MTIEELYTTIGGDLSAVLSLLATPERVSKFLGKFLDNTDYQNLVDALAAKNYTEAFRFSHNLKGMSANLALNKLKASSSALCETMRDGAPTSPIDGLFEDVKADYAMTTGAIREFLGR